MRAAFRLPGLARLVLVCGVAGAASVPFGCSTTPPEEPVQTLERAQRVASLCMQVNTITDNGNVYAPLPEALPVTEDHCNAPNSEFTETIDGEGYPYHAFALATGTLRGQLGAIDMTIFRATDPDRSTPGFNYLTVGESPTDVTTTPDSRWAFVASAAAQKPGIYGVPSIYLVGDSRSFDASAPKATDLLACALPQAPKGLAIVPNGSSADSPYDLVVTLPGDRLTPARVVGIDTALFRHPRPLSDAPAPDGQVQPGTFDFCPLKYTIDVQILPPPAPSPDLQWSDGIAYKENGARTADSYPLPTACGVEGDDDDDASDGGVDEREDPPDSGALAPLLPSRPAHLGQSTQDGTTLYVADLDNPLIHVFDLGVTPPVELAPLEVISSADPQGTVSVRDLAVSPPTRDFKRFLYAVEAAEGSLLVYDVTDKASTYRKPLVRPHAELQPFQPVDRIAFAVPVNAITFARHDVATIASIGGVSTQVTGALCNPNPDHGEDPGWLYRANSTLEPEIGPKRLRGVFALAALATGKIAVIDVDDWDSPCRRPAAVADDAAFPRASSIAEPQIEKALDPYGAPLLTTPGTLVNVTREAFFPISAPHRARSQFLLRNENDTEGGDRVPKVPGAITLAQGNTPLDLSATGGGSNPLLQPTRTVFADPSGVTSAQNLAADGGTTLTPGVRFSYEVPDVHLDQDWAIAYEGALPGFNLVRGQLTTDDDYQTLTMVTPETNYCTLGVEDQALAQQHVAQFNDALQNETGFAKDELLEKRVGDYVQVSDPLLPVDDKYWLLNDNTCWESIDASIPADVGGAARGVARRDACERTFGNPTDVLTSRDFPILEAENGKVRLGHYQYPQTALNSVRERVVVGRDVNNRPLMQALQCCFHNQVQFNVRAGGTWLTFGSANTYLHHVQEDESGRCVQSCENRERLLNSRIFAMPRETLNDPAKAPLRSSSLAMRNPMFSFFMVDGVDAAGNRLRPERDVVWRFSSRNQFQALSLSLTDTQINSNPQALRYLPSLGQVMLLDGAGQGLTLIDLRTVAFASGPVF